MALPKDDKYIVFKREDWVQDNSTERLTPVKDAIVIRRQDCFAAPALDAYANCIMATLELMKKAPPSISMWAEENMKRLQEIADYFHLQASAAWQAANRKIPD